jgi:hypothetical protein
MSPTLGRPQKSLPGPERTEHLERNRAAANKYRQKKKKEHEQIDHKLHDEAEKREMLLSQVQSLQKEVWDLKNLIFQHVRCEHVTQPPPIMGRTGSSTVSTSSQPSRSSQGSQGTELSPTQ